jgi:hypothetical protein
LIAHGNKISFISHEVKGGYGLKEHLRQNRGGLDFNQFRIQNAKLAHSSLFQELMVKELKIRN